MEEETEKLNNENNQGFSSAESIYAQFSSGRNTFKLPKIIRRSSTISKVSKYSDTPKESDISEEIKFEIDIDHWIIREEVIKPLKRPSETLIDEEKKEMVDVEVETSRILQVLEAGLRTDVSDKILPDITELTTEEAIDVLAPVLGIIDIDSNLCSFWIVDTLVYVLKRCQREATLPENQRMILTWILFVLKAIAISPEPREKMFDDIIRMLIEIDLSTNPGNPLPNPQLILEKVRERKWEKKLEKFEKLSEYMDLNDLDDQTLSSGSSGDSVSLLLESIILAVSDQSTTISNQSGRLKMYDLNLLINIIYELFGNRFMYEVMRETFSNPPEIIPVTILEDIPIPKPIFQSPPVARSIVSSVMSEKPKNKTSKNKSTLRPGSVRAKVMAMLNSYDRGTKKDEKFKNKNKYILPLQSGVDENFVSSIFESKKEAALQIGQAGASKTYSLGRRK